MKKTLLILPLILSFTCFAQQIQSVEYPIMCFKKQLGENNASYFFIISVKNVYFYNFTDHMVDDKDFKTLFWKKSLVLPLDTSLDFEKICQTKIREDQMSEKLKSEIKKLY